jgi:hypothetical protein
LTEKKQGGQLAGAFFFDLTSKEVWGLGDTQQWKKKSLDLGIQSRHFCDLCESLCVHQDFRSPVLFRAERAGGLKGTTTHFIKKANT